MAPCKAVRWGKPGQCMLWIGIGEWRIRGGSATLLQIHVVFVFFLEIIVWRPELGTVVGHAIVHAVASRLEVGVDWWQSAETLAIADTVSGNVGKAGNPEARAGRARVSGEAAL